MDKLKEVEDSEVIHATCMMIAHMWNEMNAQTARVIEILRLGYVRSMEELADGRKRLMEQARYQEQQRLARLSRRRQQALQVGGINSEVAIEERKRKLTNEPAEVTAMKDLLMFERNRAEAYRSIALMLAHHGFIKRREMINMLKGLTSKEVALERYLKNELRCEEIMQDTAVLQQDRQQVMGVMAQYFNSAILYPEGVMPVVKDDPAVLERFTTQAQYKAKMAELNASIALQKKAASKKKVELNPTLE
ncbi:hypothetical protein [Stenotrophomonas acidaminiphila]